MADDRALTMAHNQIASCLAILATMTLVDDRTPSVLFMLEKAVGAAHADGPLADELHQAARRIGTAAPGRKTREGAKAWCSAMLDADRAASAYFWQRACQMHDRLFPQNSEVTNG